MTDKKKFRVYLNSPIILGFSLICLIIVIANVISGGRLSYFLGVGFSSWNDPMMYLRLFTHVLTHSSLEHYTGNIMLMLVLGPLIEEKYGAKNLLFMIISTSLITGLINILFFPEVILLGASGIVFMLILLASFSNNKEAAIPLTAILVGLLYIGNELVNGFIIEDSISQIAHIVGGLCGAGFGCFFISSKK